MKKLFLFAISLLLFSASANALCIRCNGTGNDCWLSHSPCTKQADGSGGSHCPGPYDNLCSCDELSYVQTNTGAGMLVALLPILNAELNPNLKLVLSTDNTLFLWNTVTDLYVNLGNITSSTEGKWFKFEFSNDLNSIIMTTQIETQDSNGIIISQPPTTTHLFAI